MVPLDSGLAMTQFVGAARAEVSETALLVGRMAEVWVAAAQSAVPCQLLHLQGCQSGNLGHTYDEYAAF